MLDNVDIRSAMMSWLKSNATILATLTDTNEIREVSWQGEDFSYPDIRVTNSSIPNVCNYSDVNMTISYYSEQKSSKQALTGQGVIAKQMDNKTFNVTLGALTIRFGNVQVTSLPDAVQSDGIWRADVLITTRASEI